MSEKKELETCESDTTDGLGIGIVIATMIICIFMAIVLFIGNPDLHDAIIQRLLGVVG